MTMATRRVSSASIHSRGSRATHCESEQRTDLLKVATPEASRAILGASAPENPLMNPVDAPAKAPAPALAPNVDLDEDTPDAGGHWARIVEKRKQLSSRQFFSDGVMRAIRPQRHNPLAPDTSATAKWKRVREQLVKATTMMRNAHVRIRAARNAEQGFAHEKHGDNIWEQDHEDSFTNQVWQQRMDLQNDPAIVEEVHCFWMMLRETCAQPASRAGWIVSKGDYTKLQLCIYKALINPFDPTDARKCARDDWNIDAVGSMGLHRIDVYRMIFDVADVWCKGVRTEEYVMFLRRLMDAITHDEPRTLAPLSKIKWADLASDAEETTNENEAQRAEKMAFRERRHTQVEGKLGRKPSLAEAAAALKAFEENEQRAADERQKILDAQAEIEDAREMRIAAAKMAEEAEAKRKLQAAADELVAKRMARYSPRGFWKDGPPPEVILMWAKRAPKPSRDQFVTPTNQMQHKEQYHVRVKGAMMINRLHEAPMPVVCDQDQPPADEWHIPPTPTQMESMQDVINELYNRHPHLGGLSETHPDKPVKQQPIYARFIQPPAAATDSRPQPGSRQANRFRPNSARLARRSGDSPRLPPGAIAMQISLTRTAPNELRAFYQHRHRTSPRMMMTG